MAHDVRIAISCPDRTGLLSAITGRLFDLGADIGDASFAVLGEAAEFATVARLPDPLSAEEVRNTLTGLAELDGADITVAPFTLGATHSESGQVTHRIEVRGTDRPGLVARLTEAFSDYGANIVRMDCERVRGASAEDYIVRIEAWIPDARAQTCLAAVDNTAQSLGLSSRSEPA
ncbi:MAG: ACT domain-containing protein [Alphaproteobacteria bacterium]|jgi:glycine cleavage system transcriptional repressor|nr:ACT domain-containing protein [Alphaproteobacteria bacterium]